MALESKWCHLKMFESVEQNQGWPLLLQILCQIRLDCQEGEEWKKVVLAKIERYNSYQFHAKVLRAKLLRENQLSVISKIFYRLSD